MKTHPVIIFSSHILSFSEVQMNTIFIFRMKLQHRFEILNSHSSPTLVLLVIKVLVFTNKLGDTAIYLRSEIDISLR